MHVCDLTTLYIDGSGGGGVNTYLAEKARYLTALGIRHTIIVPGTRDATTQLFGATLHRVRSPRLPWNPQHRVLFRTATAGRLLRAARPSVVEVDCAYYLGRTARRALRDRSVPVIGFYHVHLPTFIARSGTSAFGSVVSGGIERMAWRYVRYCTQPCDHIVVTSPDIEQRLRAAGFGPRLALVPLGVNTDLFRPRPAANGGDVTEILHVGRLSHEKDLDVLLDAFRRLPEHRRWRLRVVGDGPLRDKLVRSANGDHRIEFAGARPYGEPLAELYRGADLFVNPSPNDTFNLSLLEAVSAGLPVVAAAQGGPRNLVTPDRGLLAAPGDAADFADKIIAAADDRARFRGGRPSVERGHGWQRCFERLLAVYRGAVTARARCHEDVLPAARSISRTAP